MKCAYAHNQPANRHGGNMQRQLKDRAVSRSSSLITFYCCCRKKTRKVAACYAACQMTIGGPLVERRANASARR